MSARLHNAQTILGMFIFCALVALAIAVVSFPVWAFYFNVLSFEWIVIIGLTLLLAPVGGSE